MPEGVRDGGRVIGGGHAPRGRQRPAGVPAEWVRDRGTGEWRPPRRPGPRPRDTATPDQPAGWEAERDPAAARLSEPEAGGMPPPGLPVTGEVKDDLAAAMGLVGMAVLPAAARLDPYCGGAAADAWPKISEACIPLLCRSAKVVAFMTTAGGLRDWIGLAIALQPVAEAFGRHHITRTIRIVPAEEADGEAQIRQEDFSAYPA